ncbi:MAG: LemA family protein [Sphingobacteriales bacterium]|nr:MAG: LemA family protein [Sphingobacteriales bacterium]
MILLIVLLTLVAMLVGLYRNLQRRQFLIRAAFKQLDEIIGQASETAGKFVETLRETKGNDLNEFTIINQLRWQTTSRKVSVENKAQALNELILQFERMCRQPEQQNNLKDIPQLGNLYQTWENTLNLLDTEKETYNYAILDYNNIIKKFPYKQFGRLLRILPKTALQISN